MEKHPRRPANDGDAGPLRECGLAKFFPENVQAILRAGQGFEALRDGPSWRLMRKDYEEPGLVEALDGRQNAWTITNDQASPRPLGVGIACGFRKVPTAVKAGLGGLRPPAPAATGTAAGAADGDRQRTPGRAARSIAVRSGALTSEGPGGVHFWPGGMQRRTDARRRHRGADARAGQEPDHVHRRHQGRIPGRRQRAPLPAASATIGRFQSSDHLPGTGEGERPAASAWTGTGMSLLRLSTLGQKVKMDDIASSQVTIFPV